FRRGDARRSVHDDSGADVGFLQQHLRLEQFKLETHRAQFVAQQEIGVAKGEPIGGVLLLRCIVRVRVEESRFLVRLGGTAVGYVLGIVGHLASMARPRSACRAKSLRVGSKPWWGDERFWAGLARRRLRRRRVCPLWVQLPPSSRRACAKAIWWG